MVSIKDLPDLNTDDSEHIVDYNYHYQYCMNISWNEDGTPTARTGKILNATPMGRFGEPEELVGGLLFLLDDRCSGFITGVVLPIDGGFNAYSGV